MSSVQYGETTQFDCGFHEENMKNLIIRIWLVWRLCGDNVESDTFYGDLMVKLDQKLPEVFMEQTW